MRYKDLFNTIVSLLSVPGNVWKRVREEEDGQLSGAYVYPMIALCGLAAFFGKLFGNGIGESDFQYIMTECCGVFVSLFGGYFLATFLVEQYGIRFLNRSRNEHFLCQKLVGYSMTVLFVLEIFNGLFPGFLILRWILQFYIVYIVWEGAKELMEVGENKLLSYTLVCSVIILLSPVLVDLMFSKLNQLLN